MCRREDPFDQWAMAAMGAWLRAWRLQVGVSQRVLARVSGVPQAHISRIENGLRRPSGVSLGRLLIALDRLACGAGSDPWRLMERGLPTDGARWGHAGRPPAIIGVEPRPPLMGLDADRQLDLLLGIRAGLSPEPLPVDATI